MRFGPVALRDATGATLAHATPLGDRVLRKGAVLTASDLAALDAAGLREIVVARLDPGDVPENEAARRVGASLRGEGLVADGPVSGRVNLRAGAHGVLVVDASSVDALNRHDEAVTLATLRPFAAVAAGRVVATVKVIPFAAAEDVVAAWERAPPALRLAPFRPHRAALIQTTLPTLGGHALAKARSAMEGRLARLGSSIASERHCAHDIAGIAAAIRLALRDGVDLVLVASASAIVDRRDVVPAGIVAAGGEILHAGAPIDPGNLLLLGRVGPIPVLGLPGCARSPTRNGVDLVLQRLLAGLPLGGREIMEMGVGGLLADGPERGQPRD